MPDRFSKPRLFIWITATIATNPVFAQNETNPVTEIIVDGRYLSIDKMNAVKTPTPVIDVPQSLSIVTSAQIQEQAFRNVGDILRYTPGLSVSQGEGHRDAIIIRGMQSTADFFIDGVRDDVQYYRPLYNVEQVEILRGSNALLFGRGGGGGVINRVTKQPVIGDSFSAVNSGIDSFGAWSLEGDVNIDAGDNVGFRLNGYYQELENHRDFYAGESYAFNPTMRISLNPRTTALLSYEYVEDDRVVDRGVPSVNVDNGPDIPLAGYDTTFFGSPEANFTALQAGIFRARIDHEFADNMRANVTALYADYDKFYQNLYSSEEVVLQNGLIPEVELDGYSDDTRRQNAILQVNLIGELETGALRHTLLFGGEYGSQKSQNSRMDNVFAANGRDQLFIPFSDPLDIPAFSMSRLARNGSSDVQFMSLYFQDQLDLTEEIKLVLGFRYDEFDISALDLIEQTDGDAVDGYFARTDNEITPRVGFIYKPVENISFYASYSETFLPRSGDQFLTLNPDTESTRPQFFGNLEGGVKWDIRPDLSLTAAVFRLDRESYTSADPQDPALQILIEGSETTGFEFQLTGRITDYWSLTSGYSSLDGRVNMVGGSGNDGNRTRQTPEHMFSVWNNFTLNSRLSLGVGATYQDSFFVNEDNAVEVPDYTRIDAGLFYDVSDSMRVQLNIENLLDETWYPDAHSNDNISTGKPLNARLSLLATF